MAGNRALRVLTGLFSAIAVSSVALLGCGGVERAGREAVASRGSGTTVEITRSIHLDLNGRVCRLDPGAEEPTEIFRMKEAGCGGTVQALGEGEWLYETIADGKRQLRWWENGRDRLVEPDCEHVYQARPSSVLYRARVAPRRWELRYWDKKAEDPVKVDEMVDSAIADPITGECFYAKVEPLPEGEEDPWARILVKRPKETGSRELVGRFGRGWVELKALTGDSLVYVRGRAGDPDDGTVTVCDRRTGEGREIATSASYERLSPDGRWLLLRIGVRTEDGTHVNVLREYPLTMGTEEPRDLYRSDGGTPFASYSPDGNSIAIADSENEGRESVTYSLHVHDRSSGDTKRLDRFDGAIRIDSMEWCDGALLAVLSPKTLPGSWRHRLAAVDPETGDTEVLYEPPPPEETFTIRILDTGECLGST